MTAVARRLLLAVAAVLLLAGCTMINSLLETEERLADAGFRNPVVDYTEETGTVGPVLTVSWDSTAETSAAHAEDVREIAGIVWRTTPLRFEVLELYPNNVAPHRMAETLSRGELLERFGPRPAGLQEQDFGDVGREVFRGFAIVFAVIFVVVAAVVVLIVVLVRRSRRNRPQVAYAGGWGATPGSPMWGQPQQPGAWGGQPGQWGGDNPYAGPPEPPNQWAAQGVPWGQQPPPGQWGQQPSPGQWAQPPAGPPPAGPPPAGPPSAGPPADPWAGQPPPPGGDPWSAPPR